MMGNPHRDRARRQRRDGDFSNSMSDAFARMDVSIHGPRQRNERPERHERRYDDRRQYQDRPPRKRLEFQEVRTFERGDCRVRITMAEGEHGRIYNFTVERCNRERPSRFFRDRDAADLVELIGLARDWIEGARGEAVPRRA